MIQKTVKTNFEREIRYSVEDENNDYYSWQWQDDNKKWIYYTKKNVLEIESKYNTPNISYFDLDISNKITYEINFNKMKQINKKTNFSRSIRRVKSGKFNLILNNDLNKFYLN